MERLKLTLEVGLGIGKVLLPKNRLSSLVYLLIGMFIGVHFPVSVIFDWFLKILSY